MFSNKFDLISLTLVSLISFGVVFKKFNFNKSNFIWKLYEIEDIFILLVANNVGFLPFFPEPHEEIKSLVEI